MDIIDQTIIYCQKHSKHTVKFISIQQESQQQLSCEECMMEEDQQLKDFLSIQTIQNCEIDYIFSNWPPVKDIQLLKEIQSTLKADALTINHLEEQFSSLIIQITNKLQEVKKKMFQSIVNQNEQKEQLLKCYNDISGKQKLKDFTKFNKLTFQNQFDNIKSLISQINKKKDQNTSFLKESLLKYKNSLISSSVLTEQKQSILNQVEVVCQEISLKLQKQQQLLQQQLQQQQHQQKNQLSQLFGKYAFCNLSQSDKLQILENNNEEKITIKKDQNISGQVFFNYQLNKQKSYTFRFKFNDKPGNYLIIGLIEEGSINQQLSNTCKGKIFENNLQTYGGKVMQGNYFYKIEKDQIVEMRIDIQNNQISYLDYPNYQNINQLYPEFLLDPNKNYFLAIQLYEWNSYATCIDLIYFEEVNK